MRQPLLIVAALGTALIASACGTERTADASVPPPIQDCDNIYECALRTPLKPTPPTELPGIANVFRLSKNIISGGEPLNEGALRQIADMGVKTILSVDGKAPEAAAARKLGMRYVHVPIKYTGINPQEMIRIAKTFRELPKPMFVHCFHGKHRGPAAAAIGRVLVDGVSTLR